MLIDQINTSLLSSHMNNTSLYLILKITINYVKLYIYSYLSYSHSLTIFPFQSPAPPPRAEGRCRDAPRNPDAPLNPDAQIYPTMPTPLMADDQRSKTLTPHAPDTQSSDSAGREVLLVAISHEVQCCREERGGSVEEKEKGSNRQRRKGREFEEL